MYSVFWYSLSLSELTGKDGESIWRQWPYLDALNFEMS